MVGEIDVKVNAASPNLPLGPVFAFAGSAQRIRLLGVPKRQKNWKISGVSLEVAFPDGSLESFECAQDGDAWCATVNPGEKPGASLQGFTAAAKGEDGLRYVLGKGDFYVLDSGAMPEPGVESWVCRLYPETPEDPSDGSMWFEESTLYIQSGGRKKTAVDASEFASEEQLESLFKNTILPLQVKADVLDSQKASKEEVNDAMLEANNYSDALQEATEAAVAKTYATKDELSEAGRKTAEDIAAAEAEMEAYADQKAESARQEAADHCDEALQGYYNKDEVNSKISAKADLTALQAETTRAEGAEAGLGSSIAALQHDVSNKANIADVEGKYLPAAAEGGGYSVSAPTKFLGDIELPGLNGSFTDVAGTAAITPYNDGSALGFTFSDGARGRHSQLAPDGSKVLTQTLGDARYARAADVAGKTAQLEISDGQPAAIEHGKFYCWRPSSTAPTSTSISLEDNGLENEARLYLDYRTAASQISLPAGAVVLYREGSVKLDALALGSRYFADIQWFSTSQREGEWESQSIVVVNAYKVEVAS